jgi:hypothetical protein
MGIIDGIKKLSGLWEEGSNLSIIPSRQDALAILREVEAVALKSRYFNSEQLLSSLGVPYSDIVQTASSEQLRVPRWESNIIDLLVMAGVSQFWGDVISVAPVDGSLVGSTEEVGSISSQ